MNKLDYKDVDLKEEDVLGYTKTGSLVAVVSINMYRENGFFIFGKPKSEGKMVSEDTAKNSIVEFTKFGKRWLAYIC